MIGHFINRFIIRWMGISMKQVFDQYFNLEPLEKLNCSINQKFLYYSITPIRIFTEKRSNLTKLEDLKTQVQAWPNTFMAYCCTPWWRHCVPTLTYQHIFGLVWSWSKWRAPNTGDWFFCSNGKMNEMVKKKIWIRKKY